MTTTTTARSGGISTLGLLGIVLVVLKATGYIHWSWVWVLAPFWGPWAFLLLILVGGLVLAGLAIVGAWLADRFL